MTKNKINQRKRRKTNQTSRYEAVEASGHRFETKIFLSIFLWRLEFFYDNSWVTHKQCRVYIAVTYRPCVLLQYDSYLVGPWRLQEFPRPHTYGHKSPIVAPTLGTEFLSTDHICWPRDLVRRFDHVKLGLEWLNHDQYKFFYGKSIIIKKISLSPHASTSAAS